MDGHEANNLTAQEADLVEKYLPLAVWMARRKAIAKKCTDPDALESAALVGLLRAVRTHDPAKTKIVTWVNVCVQSAMADEMRNLDHLSRHNRKKHNARQAAVDLLADQLGRTPTNADLADAGLDTAPEPVRLQALCYGLQDKYSQTKRPRIATEDSDAFRRATRSLSLIQQTILYLRFFHDVDQKKIGEVLNLSESRVSQILSSILPAMKTTEIRETLRSE